MDSMKLKLVSAFAVGAIAGIFAGCQVYDFQPVEPLAIAQTTQYKTVQFKKLKPDLMFLIDKSGSMAFPSNTSDPACPMGCGPNGSGGSNCPAACKTRISELRIAMDNFLKTSGSIARMGMAVFPNEASGTGNTDIPGCGPTESPDIKVEMCSKCATGSETVDVDTELVSTALDVNASIQAQKVGGGTPTANSIRFLGTYPPLTNEDREDFIVLLTDGLPNCNGMNANSCNNALACKCTTASCTTANKQCQAGCLDQDDTVSAITEIKKTSNIRTIVIGFGAETVSGDAPTALNAMAEAGGFARGCPDAGDGACGGAPGSCDTTTKLCTTKFFQATSAQQLTDALNQISASFSGDPCVYKLDSTPSDPRFLAVIIDGKTIPSNDPNGGWSYLAGNVTFKGALCSKVSNATKINPVRVEFRIVENI